MSIALSEQEIIRRESLQQLRELGINPYPAEAYNVSAFAKDIQDNFNQNAPEAYQNVTLAGRIMGRRTELPARTPTPNRRCIPARHTTAAADRWGAGGRR